MANPIPEGMEGVIPHLVCGGAADAIDFYKAAFDAQELFRAPAPDGRLMHAALMINGSVIYLADDYPEMNDGQSVTPKALGGTSVGMHQFVEDVDGAVAKAQSAGATVKMPPMDMFWGDRYAQVVDPFGHEWSLATHQKDLSPEEMAAAAEEAMGG